MDRKQYHRYKNIICTCATKEEISIPICEEV